jgi:hypothetical protein
MPSIAATILPFSDVAKLKRPQQNNFGDSPRTKEKAKKKWMFAQRTKSEDAPLKRHDLSGRDLDPKLRFPLSTSKSSLLSGKYTFAPDPQSSSTAANGNINPQVDAAQRSYETRVSHELKATVDSIAFIAEHMKDEMSIKKVLIFLLLHVMYFYFEILNS